MCTVHFVAKGIIGPYFFEAVADQYRPILNNIVRPKCDDYDIDGMWFQKHGNMAKLTSNNAEM